jgi:MobA/MobL family
MASYFLRSKHISRGKGARVTRAAAYRAGERIRDQRTSEVYDHSDRTDVVCKEVVLPSALEGRPDMTWTQDRAVLWNAAEHAGARRNSRLARELLVLLPPELNPVQRAGLVRGFSRELADRYRCAVDMTVHSPRPGADARNHHAHLLMTVREVGPDGLGPRTTLELGGCERHARGLGPTKADYLAIRERWAVLTNHALQQAGLAARVDHRSYLSQGINHEPTPTIPEKVFYAERGSGAGSRAGDAIRARHRERLEARAHGQEELERVIGRQKRQLHDEALRDLRESGGPGKARWASLTRDERNALRRDQYRARRAIERQDSETEARRREASRRRYHDSFSADPEAVRERRRRYRQLHADEINRKQREYRRTRSVELNLRRRELRRLNALEQNRAGSDDQRTRDGRSAALQMTQAAPRSPTPEESARAWLADGERHAAEKSAERAAADWSLSRGNGNEPERDGAEGAGADSPFQGGYGKDAGDDAQDDDAHQVRTRRDHDLEM